MDGMRKKDRLGLLPPPPPPPPPPVQSPRSRMHPTSSQLGRQHQLTNNGGGNRPFPDGLSHSVLPHFQSQHESMTDATADHPQPDPNSEDRRLRRLLSNRISAQRSRLRRTNYINEMETQVKEFEAQIAQLTPELILIQRKKKLLIMDNELMKQKKMTLQERINLKNVETEAYQTELYHLRQLFELQKQGWMAAWAPGHDDYITNQGMYQPWAQQQQQFANPEVSRPSGSEQMENYLGISMTDFDQIVANSEAYKSGKEGMADPGRYQHGD